MHDRRPNGTPGEYPPSTSYRPSDSAAAWRALALRAYECVDMALDEEPRIAHAMLTELAADLDWQIDELDAATMRLESSVSGLTAAMRAPA